MKSFVALENTVIFKIIPFWNGVLKRMLKEITQAQSSLRFLQNFYKNLGFEGLKQTC